MLSSLPLRKVILKTKRLYENFFLQLNPTVPMKIQLLVLFPFLCALPLMAADSPGTVIEEWAEDPDTVETGPSAYVNGDLIVGESPAPTESIDTILFGGLSVTGNPSSNLVILGSWTSINGSYLWPEGAGNRLVWHPEKAALRAGSVGNTQWNYTNVGLYSMATGHNTIAKGEGSVAMGGSNTANGVYSVALGNNATATADRSFAFGQGALAEGYKSLAALEADTGSNAANAIAIGLSAKAWDAHAIALGYGNQAVGIGSVAMGHGTMASGKYSATLGEYSDADAYASFVIGRYNVGGYTSTNGNTTWADEDPLFEIGIGADNSNRANALTVYKSGDVIIHKRQGDILMGAYGLPES